MSGPEFRLDAQGLIAALEKRGEAMTQATRRGFETARANLDKRMQRERLRGRPGLYRRTGRLAQSFTGEVTGARLGDLVMRYGTNVPYAPLQERGGTVRPTRAKWLTIPLPANLTAAGVMRRPIRSFPHVVFRRSSNGGLIALCGDSPGALRPMFALVKEVKIPPRLGLFDTWRQERNRLISEVNREIRRALA